MRLKPICYYIPKGISEYKPLNGEWDFTYFSRNIDVSEKIEKWDKITVLPFWQLKGYEKANYIHIY